MTVIARPQIAIGTPDWRRPVIRMPLAQAFPEFSEVKEFKSKVCLFSEDRSRVFDVVSDRYQLVEHGQAVDVVEQALSKYFTKASDLKFNIRSTANGARIRGEVRLPIAPVKIGKNDVSHLTLLLRNSYDRTSVFSAKLGAFRVVCSNGMVIGDTFGQITARHVGAQEALTEGDSILDQLDQIIHRAPMVRQVWQEWQDTPFTQEDMQEALGTWLPALYREPLLDDGKWKAPRSKWEAYNDLTHMSTHLTKSPQRRQEFDEIIAKIFYNEVELED